jgi:hypothetical protein
MTFGSLDLLGNPFEVRWRSSDGRLITDGQTCYRFTSFACHDKQDADILAQGPPREVRRCLFPLSPWQPQPFERMIANPGGGFLAVPANPPRARPFEVLVAKPDKGTMEWALADPHRIDLIRQQHLLETANTSFLNPLSLEGLILEAIADGRLKAQSPPGLPALDPKALAQQVKATQTKQLEERLANTHLTACLATFAQGTTLYFQDVVPCPIPPEALAFFQQAAQQEAVGQVIADSRQTKSALANTVNDLDKAKADLEVAKSIAGMTFQELQRTLAHTDPPANMREPTWAKVLRAAWLYARHLSMRKVAKELDVSHKTVSLWLTTFEEHTKVHIARYCRHESVKARLSAEIQQKRRQAKAGELDDE